MRIREVEQLTGLSRKTIRFYEEKGLLSVVRSGNSYREYSEEDVRQLKNIAMFRKAGVSLADIQLWQDAVITAEEMLAKRLGELKDSADVAADQVKMCNTLLAEIANGGADFANTPEFSEYDANIQAISAGSADTMCDTTCDPMCLGLDIGTTTISAVVLNIKTYESAGLYSVVSGADIPSDEPWEKMQDAESIIDRIHRLVDSLLRRFPGITSIGVTGQMHGIVYVDGDGKAVSPLYTWQDGRAGVRRADVKSDGKSSLDIIEEKTGCRLAAGYGLATHFDLVRHDLVPKTAKKIATIMDCAVISLCGLKEPLCHATNAASLGLYKDGEFDLPAIEACGMDASVLPATTEERVIAGEHRGIPVSVAIGDNQASFLGSVREPERCALINYGTGSQITVAANAELLAHSGFVPTMDVEVRPLDKGTSIICGSALCGGRAYALLERFFRSFAVAKGLPDAEQYDVLNKLAEEWPDSSDKSDRITAETTFCGTRSDPDKRGSFTGIGDNNFTAGAMTVSVLRGMANELYEMFGKIPHSHIGALVVSGNAARKNPALRKIVEETFGVPINVPTHLEEAAYGAAMFSCMASGTVETEAVREFIKYQ